MIPNRYPIKFVRKTDLEDMDQYSRKTLLGKFIKFSWFISETALLDSILTLGLYHSRYDYLNDDDFSRYVFKDCTYEDAIFIADKLERDFKETQTGWEKSVKWHGCTKAYLIRTYLKESDGYWRKNPVGMLSMVRRTTCACHETGSFYCNRRKER